MPNTVGMKICVGHAGIHWPNKFFFHLLCKCIFPHGHQSQKMKSNLSLPHNIGQSKCLLGNSWYYQSKFCKRKKKFYTCPFILLSIKVWNKCTQRNQCVCQEAEAPSESLWWNEENYDEQWKGLDKIRKQGEEGPRSKAT